MYGYNYLLANILTWPIAYFLMSNWFEQYAYHINVSAWTMLFLGFVIFVIAFVSISVRCLKTANANPADSLRNE
jgi:putative ABC transport system permease protein